MRRCEQRAAVAQISIAANVDFPADSLRQRYRVTATKPMYLVPLASARLINGVFADFRTQGTAVRGDVASYDGTAHVQRRAVLGSTFAVRDLHYEALRDGVMPRIKPSRTRTPLITICGPADGYFCVRTLSEATLTCP